MVTGKPETKITLGFLKWGYPQSSISIGVSLLLPIIALCCLVPSCKSSHPNALSMWRCMRSQKRLMRSEVTDLEFCVFKFAHWKELEGIPVIKMDTAVLVLAQGFASCTCRLSPYGPGEDGKASCVPSQ